ncbi:MAG: hypothetical protein AB8B64_23330 [Granulosicoccus sp.]
MIDPDKSIEENVIAYTAITLCGNPPVGAAPQWHELTAWREGTLSTQRSAEVLSHVANDPVYFQQWLDIAEAESFVAEEAHSQNASRVNDARTTQAAQSEAHQSSPASKLLSKFVRSFRGLFQQPLPVYGGAFAAVILAVVVAPMLRTGPVLSLQQQLTQSTDAYIEAGNGLTGQPPVARAIRSLGGLFDDLSVSEVEQIHLQTGQKRFYEQLLSATGSQQLVSSAWQEWLEELSATAVDCTQAADPEHCLAVADDFQLLGQWSLMNSAACDTLTTDGSDVMEPDFWTEQYVMYENLQSLPGVAQSARFASLLPSLGTQAPESLCTIANSVLAASQ